MGCNELYLMTAIYCSPEKMIMTSKRNEAMQYLYYYVYCMYMSHGITLNTVINHVKSYRPF